MPYNMFLEISVFFGRLLFKMMEMKLDLPLYWKHKIVKMYRKLQLIHLLFIAQIVANTYKLSEMF